MIQPRAYEGAEPYIFISYAHKDSDRVLPIISALQERGFRVWYDAGIEAGTEWPEYIAERLDGCTVFLSFISDASLKSQNCRREINFAIELLKEQMAIYLEDVKLSLGMRMQLGTLQAMFRNRHSTQESFLEELCRAQLLKPCLGSSTQPVAAQPTKKNAAVNPEEEFTWGNEFYSEKLYTEAVRYYLRAAEGGHAEAQFRLATCYERGRGVDINEATAARWYHMAAEQGHKEAQFLFGQWLEDGIGVSEDKQQAMVYYRKAAENGHVKAQYALAVSYDTGNVVPEDKQQALKWYQKAAENGHPDAQNYMGDRSRDEQDAVNWWRKAAVQGHAAAQFSLADILRRGYGLIRKDENEAAGWYLKAAQRGHAKAQYRLGDCYNFGFGIKKDAAEAKKWYLKAAEQGEAEAQYVLAGLCTGEEALRWYRKAADQGHEKAQVAWEQLRPEPVEMPKPTGKIGGVPSYTKGNEAFERKTYAEALRWYRKAADAGHPDAHYKLGYCSEKGLGFPAVDKLEAINWYRKAVELGSADAKTALARLELPKKSMDLLWYQMPAPPHEKSGENYRKASQLMQQRQEAEAVKWFLKAAKQVDPLAYHSLAICYIRGFGVPKNDVEAAKWFRKAAERGLAQGMRDLGRCYYEGRGVVKNRDEAIKWYCEAARAGDQWSKEKLILLDVTW